MVTSQKILLIILILLLIIGTALLLTHFVIPEKYSSGEHVISADGLNSSTERPEFDKDFTQDVWNKGIRKDAFNRNLCSTKIELKMVNFILVVIYLYQV